MAIAIEPPVLTADNIERTVRELLAGHDLFHVPVNPVAVAQALGLSVFDADFGGEAVSGMLRKTRDRHEILVNSCHSPTRKRFIIAHELGHYVLHKDKMDPFIDPDVNLFRSIQADRQKSADRTIEAQANMFSAALLMPAELVRAEFDKTHNLRRLARLFQVSQGAMGNRLNNLDLG